MANLESIRELLAEQLKMMLGAELHLEESDGTLAGLSTDSLVLDIFRKNARLRAIRIDALGRNTSKPDGTCTVTQALVLEAQNTSRFSDSALRDIALVFVLRRIHNHALISCDNAQLLAAALGEVALESQLNSFAEQRREILEELSAAAEGISPYIV